MRYILINLLLSAIFCAQCFSMSLFDFLKMDAAQLRTNLAGCLQLQEMISNELVKNPNSDEYYWIYAAMYYFQGDYYESDPAKKKAFFNKTKLYAAKALSINSNSADGHYWLGIGEAKWAEANGILDSLFAAPDIKDEMTKIIKIQPDYFHGIAFAVRAKVYDFAPGWPISVGDKDKAYQDLATAMKYGPDSRIIYQQYAEILMNDNKYIEAKKMIENALALPLDEKFITEDSKCIRDLKTDLEIVKKHL